jgi:thioredoxin reductase (NADPH)
LTAAVYAARANLNPIVIEGLEPERQLTLTSEVENFPGFPTGVMGPELMENFKKQALKFGSRFEAGQVTKVDFKSKPLKVWVGEKELSAAAVIVASGASARWLGIDSEKKFRGKGVSTCATCDGAFYRNLDVIVVGGGDSAMEEANFLTRFCKKVILVHRRSEFRASKIMIDRAKANSKIEFVLNSEIEEIKGDKLVEVVTIKNVVTKEKTDLKVQGIFVAIGHVPNTAIFKGQLEMNDQGYLKVLPESTMTNVPGVFSAGDVHDFRYRQAITAAGSGCKAAMDAEKYLEHLGH